MGNIIITFLRINDAQNIRNILVRNGWGNVSICTSGAGTLAMADQLESGVVICGYRLPDMAYMQLKEDLPAGFQMLLIASNSVMTGASSAEVTHMETPLKVQELIQTIHFMEEDAAESFCTTGVKRFSGSRMMFDESIEPDGKRSICLSFASC